MVVYELRAWGSAPPKPALDELSSCALISPSPWEMLPDSELLEDSGARNIHCYAISLPAFSHLLLRHSLIARFARAFLSSKNKQANTAQGPNASHEVLHCGLRPLSPTLSHLFQIFKDCRKAGTSGEHLAQSLAPAYQSQHYFNREIASYNRDQVFLSMGASSTYRHGSDSNQSDWFTASGAEGQETPTKQIASKSFHIFRFFWWAPPK